MFGILQKLYLRKNGELNFFIAEKDNNQYIIVRFNLSQYTDKNKRSCIVLDQIFDFYPINTKNFICMEEHRSKRRIRNSYKKHF